MDIAANASADAPAEAVRNRRATAEREAAQKREGPRRAPPVCQELLPGKNSKSADLLGAETGSAVSLEQDSSRPSSAPAKGHKVPAAPARAYLLTPAMMRMCSYLLD